jgi:uncharacterized protein (DUF305 family)
MEDFVSLRFLLVTTALVSLSVATASCQQTDAAPASTPIVQPGAPGHSNKMLTPETAAGQRRAPTEADVKFMQGMIMHHGQAVQMTALLKTRSHDKQVQELGERINISQTDEMRYMKQWLTDRGEPLSEPMDMPGMDMSSMPMMPGMLTQKQMEALAKADGPEFDHLFLTGMIQHHTGALTMVKDLYATPGAGQDPYLFDFTTDVDNTQQAEIDIMRGLLNKEKQ